MLKMVNSTVLSSHPKTYLTITTPEKSVIMLTPIQPTLNGRTFTDISIIL